MFLFKGVLYGTLLQIENIFKLLYEMENDNQIDNR